MVNLPNEHFAAWSRVTRYWVLYGPTGKRLGYFGTVEAARRVALGG
jgi:hypothetical protein